MLEDVGDDLADPLGREQRLLGVDRGDLLVGDRLRHLDRVDVVDAERQHVLVGDRVDDRVRVQLVAERLLGGPQLRVAAARGVDGEDRRAGEAEQVVALERLGDRGVHVAELRAVALVEDDHDVPAVDLVALVGGDERASFWIVVMMIRAPGSSSCCLSTAVEVLEFAAPFSKRSYSRIVW